MNLFKKSHRTFDEVSSEYIRSRQGKLAPRSVSNHRSKIKIYSEYLESVGLAKTPMHRIDRHMIASFLNDYLPVERSLDRPTIDKYFMVLKSVFRYAQKLGETDSVPFDLYEPSKKKEDKSAEIISPEHLKILLPYMEKHDPQLYFAAMMEYFCFIRPGTELRLMRVRDVDLAQGIVLVIQEHAKNGHKRILTMPKQLIEICKRFGVGKANKDLFLFGRNHSFDSHPVSVNMFSYRFRLIRDRLKLPKGYKFYSFKHTGATMLHNSNVVSLRGLMDQLGHSKLSATQHYIKGHAGTIDVAIRNLFPDPYPQRQFMRTR